MRIDKYLKVSRLIKRRTVASSACSGGRVKVNDKEVKASYLIKPGDIIEIRFGENISKVEVLEVKDVIRKDDAKELYKYL